MSLSYVPRNLWVGKFFRHPKQVHAITDVLESLLLNRVKHACGITSIRDPIKEAMARSAQILLIGSPMGLKLNMGTDATLDDVFIQAVGNKTGDEAEKDYGDARLARSAVPEPG